MGSLPRVFAIPAGTTLVIRYVSCEALVDPGTSAYIHFIVLNTDGPQLSLIPNARSAFNSALDRIAATAKTLIYLGINPSIGPPAGNEIEIFGQRGSAIASGGVTCSLSGRLRTP